jgi:hypothetical protein
LQQAVLERQGLITEGYKEQAASFENMQSAALMAASAEKTQATGDFIAGGVSAVASIATLPIGV